MSPLGIGIMLHYNSSVDDYRQGDLSAPAVRDLIDAFMSEGMIEANQPPMFPDYSNTRFRITVRGRAYVDALRRVPYPVNRWVMPPGFEKLQETN